MQVKRAIRSQVHDSSSRTFGCYGCIGFMACGMRIFDERCHHAPYTTEVHLAGASFCLPVRCVVGRFPISLHPGRETHLTTIHAPKVKSWLASLWVSTSQPSLSRRTSRPFRHCAVKDVIQRTGRMCLRCWCPWKTIVVCSW